MSNYHQILYHIVFRTKSSKRTLSLEHNENLFRYTWGIINQKKGHLYRINAMEEHVHILSDLHPTIALSDFIRDIKTSTSIWLKKQETFSYFEGWAEGYCALTYSFRDKNTIIEYIKNQQEHHQKESFEDEYRRLLEEQGVKIDERYFP